MVRSPIKVPERLARKIKKLRKDPGAFVYDLIAKRSGKPTRAQLGLTDISGGRGFLGAALARGESHLGDAVLSAIEQLQGDGFALGRADGVEPLIIAYYPAAFVNPFQRLLYRRAPDHGCAAVPLASLDELAKIRLPGRLVCHIHWLSEVLRDAADEADGRRRIGAFLTRLSTLKAAGTSLAWTVHNVLPHNARMPELEVELRKKLIEQVDAIHVMSEHSEDETRDLYELPSAKVFHSPHPNYAGSYPDFVSSNAARLELSIKPDETALVFFGSIQPYKGVRELLEAFTSLPEEATASSRLIVAGVPSDREYVAGLNRDFSHLPNVTIDSDSVHEGDVQIYLRAADYVVCPYRASLNSGVAVLAHDFDAPLIGPRSGEMGAMIAAGGGVGFEPGNLASLREALAAAISTPRTDFRDGIEQSRASRVGASNRFFEKLREALR